LIIILIHYILREVQKQFHSLFFLNAIGGVGEGWLVSEC